MLPHTLSFRFREIPGLNFYIFFFFSFPPAAPLACTLLLKLAVRFPPCSRGASSPGIGRGRNRERGEKGKISRRDPKLLSTRVNETIFPSSLSSFVDRMGIEINNVTVSHSFQGAKDLWMGASHRASPRRRPSNFLLSISGSPPFIYPLLRRVGFCSRVAENHTEKGTKTRSSDLAQFSTTWKTMAAISLARKLIFQTIRTRQLARTVLPS